MTNLTEDDDAGTGSDAEYVLSRFREHGFGFATCHAVKATDVGSCTLRHRLFFIGVRCPPMSREEFAAWNTWAFSVLSELAAPRFEVPTFLDCFDANLEVAELKMMEGNRTLFEDDHFDIYKTHKVAWQERHKVPLKGLPQTQRRVEAVAFCHIKFPCPVVSGVDDPCPDGDIQYGYEFLDANHSLSRLISYDNKGVPNQGIHNPWRPFVPTITCKSSMILRISDGHGNFIQLRTLSGTELMRFIGWPAELQEDWEGTYSNDDLTKIAGDAFNGFQVASVLSMTLSLVGHIGQSAGTCSTRSADKSSSSSNSSSSAESSSSSDSTASS